MRDATTDVLLTVDGGVCRVEINRPQVRNALDLASMRVLADAVERAVSDPEVRCIVLSGVAGSFCAGGDLAASVDEVIGTADEMMSAVRRVVTGLVRAPQPVIAAVEGPAVGVGASLALAADLVLASASAYFVLPFATIGLVPDGGTTATVVAAVGRARAMELVLRGGRLPAQEAREAGLVAAVSEPEEFAGLVDEWARGMASAPRDAVAQTKALINEQALPDLDVALSRETRVQKVMFRSADYRQAAERFAARSSKRTPRD